MIMEIWIIGQHSQLRALQATLNKNRRSGRPPEDDYE
jgi:hypothetical protein